jgi:hypothetical protein
MSRAALGSLLALALLAGAGACDGGEIVVFAPAQAGAAGVLTDAGAGGLVAAGGVSGSFAGALAAAGSGGNQVSGGGGSGGNTVDEPCRTTDDCDPAWFCQKQDCSDPSGVCLPRPVSEDSVRKSVCGCDHVTYWNDTLRQQYGISAIITIGECRSGAKQCDSSDDCPNGSCSQMLPDPTRCGMPGKGQCWVIPNECAPTDPPGGLPCPVLVPAGQRPPCLTTCQALKARQPYVRLPPSYSCP